MIVNIRGVRGSIPVTGPETAGYGGNTSCADVSEAGWLLVLDGGSGIQKVTMPPGFHSRRIDILLTHLHLDHIQGLGFFQPLFDPSMEIHIWGPASSSRTLHARLSRYLSPPLFPVLIRDLPCKLVLHDIENSDFEIGPFKIKSRFVIHPGPTVGFRVESGAFSFCFLPDHEPALGGRGLPSNPNWISGYDLARESSLLYHDAQYTKPEYAGRMGWGHSSMEDTVSFSKAVGTRHVLLGHHDPGRTDPQLDILQRSFDKLNRDDINIDFAREGTSFRLE
ncbi:MAG TPA: MBL fold metallo-hydrolase [Bacteroidia bacterium]|nr:MBL fold metallo-hydrolase [Bacteroidia bacterium]